MKKLAYLSLIALLLSFTSCEKDPPEVESGKLKFVVTLSAGSLDVKQNEVINLVNGQAMNISLFRLYFSDITLIKDGSELEIMDVALLDPGFDGQNSFTLELDDASYDSMKFGLGVNSEQNNSNPGDFDNSHPLSTYQSMYWSMLKYRFAKFEGKGNSEMNIGTGSDVAIAFHPGTDSLYQQVSLPIPLTIKEGNTRTVQVNIDLDKMFAMGDNIDVTDETQTQTHSTPQDIDIARRFMTQLKSAITIQ